MIGELGRRGYRFVNGILEHVKLSPNIAKTVKGKLWLGTKLVQFGSEKIFHKMFNLKQGDKLLSSAHCYLSTSAGPIAGLLFVSTHVVAFCSDRPIIISSPQGELGRLFYKVMIPVKKVGRVNQRNNVSNPSKKYIQVVTVDGFDFWFMGFLNYEKAFKFLQKGVFSED
ncbi:GEM-like protein 4 [Benincasa hispida]|uniref:GEM-like protein 4 n=1 Tax=Benincasa hispida TaxID=102211 RepID=UPI0019020812|nr:GEM-like protein 4 [Benincasa hispida]